MAQSATESRQYFLGIAGEQVGPLSETALIDRIRKGTVPLDTLVWFEGLADWQQLSTIDSLKNIKPGTGSESPAAAPFRAADLAAPRPSAHRDSQEGDEVTAYSFAEGDSAGEPVFGGQDNLYQESSFAKHRTLLVGGGVASIAVVLVASFYFWANTVDPSKLPTRAPVAPSQTELRQIELRKALSELYTKPDTILPQVLNLFEKNHDDTAGKEALQAAVDYYRHTQKTILAGDLLMKAKQPAEAVKLYLLDPPHYRQAEAAYYAAFQGATGATKKTYLLESIRLLLGSINDVPTATLRVRELEKEFPGEPHPYGYYLKSVDDRIDDLFSRTSFYYVQKLMQYVSTELAQINLLERPRVEVKKDKNGRYRVVGLYKGEVALNSDRLKAITFVFWLVGERWTIVETNITPERQKFAKAEKAVQLGQTLSGEAMLSQMETVFRTQFPKNALHETVNAAAAPVDPFQ